jgi:molybdopterin synthase catalytic subunit
MQVRVLFFGVLKDVAGKASETIFLPEPATLANLLSRLQQEIPHLNSHLSSIATSINQEYAPRDSALKSGDEVALLPPVSGGSETALQTPLRAAIVSERIETQALAERIRRPEDGAIAIFEGIVRNHSRGRRTLFLDYEAYPEMALKQMEALVAESLEKFAIREAVIVHRIGRLQIGETSVAIFVASAHRSAAFEACRWLIDTLKRTVPIWKKEYFEDGAVWADGQPFPAEITNGAGSTPENPASK